LSDRGEVGLGATSDVDEQQLPVEDGDGVLAGQVHHDPPVIFEMTTKAYRRTRSQVDGGLESNSKPITA
jgi:hypothetical protein